MTALVPDPYCPFFVVSSIFFCLESLFSLVSSRFIGNFHLCDLFSDIFVETVHFIHVCLWFFWTPRPCVMKFSVRLSGLALIPLFSSSLPISAHLIPRAMPDGGCWGCARDICSMHARSHPHLEASQSRIYDLNEEYF